MSRVTFVQPDGQVQTVDANEGQSAMMAALGGNVSGILAECGGQAMCATCHVYVSDGPVDRLPEMQEDEDEMLESTACPRKDNSRLSCQLPMTAELDGLIVELPEEQV